MVRKSLLAVFLLAIASPLAAQEDYTWTSRRPDAVAPAGVTHAEVLSQGQFRLSYRFLDLRSTGVWYQKDSLPLATTLEWYSQAPISLDNKTHFVTAAWGATEDVTLVADVSYSRRHREQMTTDGLLYTTSGQQLGDTRVVGLFQFFDQNGYRAHLQLGALIPTGGIDVSGETPYSTPSQQALPYDMQPGAGTFAVLPGLTVQAQNGQGSIGAQFQGTFYFGTNSNDYRLGDRYLLTGWAAVRINDYFSASARLAYQHWGRIQGAQPGLDATLDPGNDAYFLNGQRLDIPFGVNFYLPEGSRFAGQRLTLEGVYPVYHNYDGPQLGLDWGLNLGWQVSF